MTARPASSPPRKALHGVAPPAGWSEDRLLDGRVVLRQPVAGYRSAIDPEHSTVSYRTDERGYVLLASLFIAWVAMDARMGEVYTGCFVLQGNHMTPVGSERVCPPEEALPGDPDRWSPIGSGFEHHGFLERLVEGRGRTGWPRASVLAALAAAEAAELFGYRGGNEWWVTHVRMASRWSAR